MRTVQNISPRLAASKAVQLLILALTISLVGQVGAQPTNDNFVNSLSITGMVGQITGDNTNATLELGEATLVNTADFGPQQITDSVWYKWTAPASGNIDFDTIGSTYDTVLAIYTGTSISNRLLLIADDQSGGLNTSKVTLSAVAGTDYYIAVDAWGFVPQHGTIILNWGISGATSGGSFRFTSKNYTYSQNESQGATDNRGFMIAPPARATLTRVAGFSGMVNVGYIVTNTFYTNIWTTNFFGTNIISSVTSNSITSFTNTFNTNVVVQLNKQNYEDGQFVSCDSFQPGSIITVTNASGGPPSVTFTNVLLTNLPPCLNFRTVTVSNDGAGTTFTNITLIFCTNAIGTQIVASARAGVDYFPREGTAVFRDFEMSQDVLVPVFNANFFNRPTNMVNPLVIVVATNAVLDAVEDQTLPPANLDTNRSTAFLTFLNTEVDVHAPCGTRPTAGTILNLERSVIQCDEYILGTHLARVGVLRTGTNFSAGASCTWRIDYVNPADGRNNVFPLQPGSDYATPFNAAAFSSNVDFTYSSGTLNWGANDAQVKYIDIDINDDDLVEFNEDFQLELHSFSGASTGLVNTATVTILADPHLEFSLTTGNWSSGEQTAGSADRSYNPDNDTFSAPHPNNALPGANGTVYASLVQPDGNLVIGGDFTAYNTDPHSRIARVLPNGMVDSSFDAGILNGYVAALALDSSGSKIIVGGGFTSINGQGLNHIARLNSSGSVDNSFDPALGADDNVSSVVVQPDGKVLIAGDFTQFNGTNRSHIARLNVDGSLDIAFDPAAGPNASIHSIALQSDGRVVIGGSFTNVNGFIRNRIARLNTDGSLDTTFDPAPGAETEGDAVYAVAVQADGNILAGGFFSQLGFSGGNNLARLTTSGSVDTNFDIGPGVTDTVLALTLQPDNKILIGGFFGAVNETRRVGVARLFIDGSVDTTFMDTAYNQFAGIPNAYHDPNVEPPNFINTIALQADGNVIIGGSFVKVGGGFTRTGMQARANVTRLVGGGTPGPGNIGLTYNTYNADVANSQSFLTLTRSNGTLGPASATILALPFVGGPGAAVYGTDYVFTASTPTWGVSWSRPTWMLSDGYSGPNNLEMAVNGANFYTGNTVFVNILTNSNPNTSLGLGLTQPNGNDLFFLGGLSANGPSGVISVGTQEGENIPLGVALGRRSATMNIIHNNLHPGVFVFSSPTYYVSENGVNASATVIRTGGSDGTVTVRCATTTGGTGVAGTDYTARTNTLTFLPGITNQTFSFPVSDNTLAQPDRTVVMRLFTPTGGATVGGSNSVMIIVDNDYLPGHVSFDSATYGVSENVGTVPVTVTRLGGNVGTLTALVGVTNGTAINGVNFAGLTNMLTWANGDVATKVVNIPVLNDGIVTANLIAKLRLFDTKVNTTNSALALGGAFTNATLTITNTDAIGTVQFTTTGYSIAENGGEAIVPIIRVGGSAQTISASFAALSGTALDGSDFNATNGVLVFGPGEVSKSFRVPIIDNGFQDGNRFISLAISNAAPTNGLGSPSAAILNIVDNETYNEPAGDPDVTFNIAAGFNDSVFALALQGDGKLLAGGDFTTANGVPRRRLARLNSDGTLDSRFSSYLTTAGANSTVRALAVQTDGRILVGGFFTNINNTSTKRLARLNYDGSLDSSFVNGSGADNPVYAIAETFVSGQRRILVGGAFTTMNGVSRNSIAQLRDDGSVDTVFNPASGANGTVYALAVQTDGKVILGGDFTTVRGVALNHIARLNLDGTVDPTFSIGTGASESVRALKIQLDGRIVIGGIFTNINGTALNHIARLNANGSVDNTFTPGVGANDNVEAIALQTDTKIVLGGDFTQCNGVTRNRITRLNPDGTVDPSINFGTGADSFIAALIMEEGLLANADGHTPDEKIIIGGGFLNYNSQAHAHVARIYGGSLAGSGTFEFTSAVYQADEVSSNAVITVRRKGGTSGPNANGSGSVTVDFATSPNTAVAGINYSTVNTTLTFPAGEVIQNVVVPVFDDQVVTPDLAVDLTLSNPSALTGLGNQPIATLFILNDDSTISLSSPTYSVAKSVPTGTANIGIIRQGTTNGTVSVIFQTTTNGTGVIGTDYLAVSNVITFAPGVVSNNVVIPIINNILPQGNRTVTMILSNAVTLVTNGANLLLAAPSAATLTIIDTVQAPGQLLFAATNIVAGEANSNVVVSVIRTNGTSGTVQVSYTTVAGTAQPGVNYTTTSGTLTFGNGETVKTFNLPLLENSLVQGAVNLSLVLSNPSGGASLLTNTNLPVTILDNDAGISFSSAAYVANETNGVVILNVLRQNNTSGTVLVSYATTNGSALATTNYLTTTGTLTFNPGETNKSINIPILHDFRATSNLTFGVNLSNPTGGAQLAFPTTASVIVLDAEAGLGFTNANFTVLKSGTNAILTVFCSNPNAEPISVNYSSADGTAVAGIDYGAVSGVLTFTNGMVTNYILVPIINNALIEGDLNFTVALASPTAPGQIIAPSTATVTITDNNAGFSFSSPTYTVFKNGVNAVIGVTRSGYTNSTASVNFTTLDGSGTNGLDYTTISGTLVFTNGQTSLTFSVPVTDSTTVKPDKTVLLQLSNPVGTNAVLVTPSAALLTIRDNSGSLVLPAGVALLTESGPVNGVIDPTENVSLLFALRNGGGTNTANLTATLLATNGITSPSAAQNYGSLLVNGPSTSRQYSFIASGSNGQQIVATFLLTNGTVSAGSASFTFTLGNNGASFTNSGAIIIPLQGAASPYPSTINVSGVGGSLTKATVTLNKLHHGSASDIDALLVSPTGQKTLLMANAGGFNGLTGVTLTFDDAATAYLPQNSAITAGTNKPTPYFPVAVFPAPAPAAPYTTNLAAFNGSNPNGTWSLYILDDTAVNSGMVSNGWSLSLTAVNLVGSTADLVANMTAPSSVIVSNNLTYTLTVTNFGPSTATGVSLSDALPSNVSLVSSNASQGGITVVGNQVTWNAGTLPINTGAVLTLVVQPSAIGSLTNSCTVAGNESDPNLVNNSATAISTVAAIKADLMLSMVDAPDPLWSGNNITYTITVTNIGPATAPSVTVTNTLPPSVVLVSASPSGYLLSGSVLAFTNLGNILVGGQTVATIVVRTTTGGTLTNTAFTTSQVTDPLKANNSATVKTVVNLLQLGMLKSGSNLVISWPTNTAGYVLECATNLSPSAVWTAVVSPAAVVSGGQFVVTNSIGAGAKFFRLRAP